MKTGKEQMREGKRARTTGEKTKMLEETLQAEAWSLSRWGTGEPRTHVEERKKGDEKR